MNFVHLILTIPIISFIILLIITQEVGTSIAFTVLTFIVSTTIICLLASYFSKYEIRTARYRIESISDVFGVEGSFTLGSGSINNTYEYYYYYKTTNGGYKVGSIPAYNTEIFEWDRNYAVKEYTYEHGTSKGFWRGWYSQHHYSSLNDKCILRVPKGTIIKNYKIDLN